MTPHVQTNLVPGNCWQTVVACLLDIAPESMPDQVAIEEDKRSFNNALIAYLSKHHHLSYAEIPNHVFSQLRVVDPGWHILIGETVRTTESGRLHAVVGRYGEVFWDPHPTGVGLTSVRKWGLLTPLTEDLLKHRVGYVSDYTVCQCPDCGGFDNLLRALEASR